MGQDKFRVRDSRILYHYLRAVSEQDWRSLEITPFQGFLATDFWSQRALPFVGELGPFRAFLYTAVLPQLRLLFH